MKMKKILTISAIVVLAAFICVSIAESQSSTDYKIIKNAVKKNGNSVKNSKDLILHMTVQNNNDKPSVIIEIPFDIVEYLLESCKDADINWGEKKSFKLHEAISKLKASGPMTIIEINNFEDNNSTVKIWLE
jgi:hypothetical protein